MVRFLAAAALLLCACHRGAGVPAVPAGAAWEADNPVRALPAPPLGVEIAFKALGVTPEKVRLGRWLFYDTRLSSDATVSCASCHRPQYAFSEPTAVSTGVGGRTGTRKSPPIVNAANPTYPVYFWDGRAHSLADQAKGPMANPAEMAMTHPKVVERIAGVRGYRKHFHEAFGDERVDIDRIAEALAAYEATRLSGNSAADRFDAGDESALSKRAQQGRELFFGRARCSKCHDGPNYTDGQFHNIGIGFELVAGKTARESLADPGRHAITQDDRDLGAFKTPTLRDVSKHAPYMHDGSLETLEDVVFYYLRAGNQNPWIDPEMARTRFMPYEMASLVAFLEALDGEGYADVAPASFPR